MTGHNREAGAQSCGSQAHRGFAPSLRNCPRAEWKQGPGLFRDEAHTASQPQTLTPSLRKPQESSQRCGARQCQNLRPSLCTPQHRNTPEEDLTGSEAARRGCSLGRGKAHSCRPRGWTGTGRAGTPRSTASGYARGIQGTAPEERAGTRVQTRSHRSVRNA